MTKTKLEIIGPYTPEHEGPFCTRDGLPARIISRTGGSTKYPVVAIIDGCDLAGSFEADGSVFSAAGPKPDDLMNAREVPVAREFWVNEYYGGGRSVYLSEEEAEKCRVRFQRTIHVREVLPGDGE
ncbi:hypothetical protein [Komagataeibacter diospyri]|uniref:Uncharacterized protein n=1 Tax=Komagataeibacter diospyri TaxID=1932662 RepID=A0A4P5NTK9_9PROT|nr:hypothetical protein [Komagataeibacter diospyri]GCE85118.1 hypothetical protein MSKU9_3259 [Komagataeibacter diospyri]